MTIKSYLNERVFKTNYGHLSLNQKGDMPVRELTFDKAFTYLRRERQRDRERGGEEGGGGGGQSTCQDITPFLRVLIYHNVAVPKQNVTSRLNTIMPSS